MGTSPVFPPPPIFRERDTKRVPFPNGGHGMSSHVPYQGEGHGINPGGHGMGSHVPLNGAPGGTRDELPCPPLRGGREWEITQGGNMG